MVTVEDALAQLVALGDPAKATEMQAYHKTARRFLGVPMPLVEPLVADWRAACSLDERVTLAAGLWASDIHEAMIAATKLLTQARIRPDGAVWDLIQSWVPGFDSWAIADHACSAGSRRVMADLARMDTLQHWTEHDNFWVRRAALVITLPLARLNHLKPAEQDARERVLGWAEGYADDPEWFIQKAIGWWLRDLSRHDEDRVVQWVHDHGARLKPFARREALRLLET